MAFFFSLLQLKLKLHLPLISCSVLITGAFPLINGVNIHELFNTIEIKRPVRHFTISDFFFNSEQKRAYNCKIKKSIIFYMGYLPILI